MNHNLFVPPETAQSRTARTWLTIAARSFAAAAVAGAAQLGAAHALAILVWSPAPPPDVWRRQLTWLTVIFAASVLVGVAGGRRSVRAVRLAIAACRAEAAARRTAAAATAGGPARRSTMESARNRTVDAARGVLAAASRVSATLFASLGAAVAFLLVWLPARESLDRASLSVLMTAAGAGIAVGALVSLLSLAAAPIAANAAMWGGGVWILGIASVAPEIVAGWPPATPLLGVLDVPRLIGPDEWWLGPSTIVVIAVLFAGTVAAVARWVREHRVAVALSGLAGPSIVVAAYVIVGRHEDVALAYTAAVVAAAAGGLTSIVTAGLGRRTRKPAPAEPVPPAELSDPPCEPAASPAPAAEPVASPAPSVASPAPPAEPPAAPVLLTWAATPAPAARPAEAPTAPARPAAIPAPLVAVAAADPAIVTTPPPAATPAPTPAADPVPTSSDSPPPRSRRDKASIVRTDADKGRSAGTRRIDRDAKPMRKSEREHVDWVKHLTSIPPDPTLLKREW